MMNWNCILCAVFLSLLSFELGSSATGVCTRTVQSSPSNYTEEYCCSGYSGTPPDCQRLCLGNGSALVTTYDTGGIVTYTCQGGFDLSSCTNFSGTWPGVKPVCNYTIACPYPDPLGNGSVIVSNNYGRGSVYYMCNPGYRILGSSNRYCQSSGNWSGTQPTCFRSCSYLPNLAHGRISLDTSAIGGVATYTCSSGYTLSGVSNRTCLSSGNWSDSAPICTHPVMCPSLDDPTNGWVLVESTFYGGRAYYYCDSGYRLSDPSYSYSITCLLSGEWSGTQPTCIRSCDYLRSPNYGRVSVTTHDVGGRAFYSCNSGFELLGPFNRTCLSDGNWTGSQPVCNYTLSVLCSSLTDPDNGFVTVRSMYVGGRAYYGCNSGYRLSRYTRRTCQLSGNWSGTQPTCIRSCDSLRSPRYGRVSVTTRDIGGRATYSCDNEYELVGPSNRTCLPSWGWSGSEPFCNYTLSVFCPSLEHPDNGFVSAHSMYVGERVYYRCNVGFELSENSDRICLSSGEWSGSKPMCMRSCSPLSSPRYGRISVTTRNVGGNATYSCNSGFRLVGPSTRTCLSDGSWSGSKPICNYTVRCPSLDNPSNGFVSLTSNFVGGSASYWCNSGYRLSSHSSSRTCQLSGEWSGMQPTCIKSCSHLGSPQYGRVSMTSRDIGSNAIYSCNSGFRLSGPSTRTCLTDGSWSGSAPVCNYTVRCPTLDYPDNGSVWVSSHFVGGSAQYFCNSGYRINETSHSGRVCQLSGDWSGMQPTCIRICPHLPPLYFGTYSMTNRRDIGSEVTYTCNNGFELIGPSNRTCLTNGSWSGSTPSCNYTVLCPALNDLDNGTISGHSRYVGESVYYRCDPGYRLSGYSTRTCLMSGEWSGTQPRCIRTCDYIFSFNHGHVSLSTSNVGGIATYTCNSGFRLVGPSTRTCLSDGTWSGSEPVCNYTVLCPHLDGPDNGAISVSSNFVGGRATYSCNSGYRLSVYSSRTCRLSGEWSGTQPACIRKCDYLRNPSHGRVSVTTRDDGGRATYSCDSGFRVVGPSTRTCLSDGSWSGSEPVCNYTVLCPSLNDPVNGSVSVSSNFVGGRLQ